MSLYNMIMGRNPMSPHLLACLGITMETAEKYPLGRIRDVTTNDAGDRVFILTRNYGTEWEHVDAALAKHPNYITKKQETVDSTYTTYEFSVPEETKKHVKEMAEMGDNTPPMERYRQLIDDMGKGKDNEATRHAIDAGKKLLGPILEKFKQNEQE